MRTADCLSLAGIERVLLGPRAGFFVEPRDVRLELLAVDAPDPAATDLDRGEASATDQGIHLGHADAEVGGYIFEGQKPGLDPRRRPAGFRARRCHAREFSTEAGQELGFDAVCFFLSGDGSTERVRR